jgi:hypothetical protein
VVIPTVVTQIAGTVAILSGTSAFSIGISQIIAGTAGGELGFHSVKEGFVIGTTSQGSAQDLLLAGCEVVDLLADLSGSLAGLPSDSIGDLTSMIQYAEAISDSAGSITHSIRKYGSVNTSVHLNVAPYTGYKQK